MVAPDRALFVIASLACTIACDSKTPAPVVTQPVVGVEGAPCYSAPCNAGLVCTPMSRRCARPDDPEILAAQERDRARERMFLRESGVEPSEHAEKPAPAPPPAPPAAAAAGAIRIVRTSTNGQGAWVIAACRPDERLVSGGCVLDELNRVMQLPSYPTSDSPTDTLGARWTCGWREATYDLKLEAFALCQRP